MKQSRIYKGICILTLASIISFIPVNTAVAASRSSLNSEMEQINAQIKEKENEKSQIKSEKSQTLSEVESLIYQISSYESEISSLTSEINSLQSQIGEAKEKIAAEERNYNKLNDEMQERLLVIYEAGDTSFLDILLGSSDLVDLISNYYIASEIAKADSDMLEEIARKKNEIEAAKDGLEDNKSKLEQKRTVQQQKSRALA